MIGVAKMLEVLRIFVEGVPQTKGSWKPVGRFGRTRLIPDNEEEPVWAQTIAWAARARLRNAPAVKARYAVRLLFTLPAPVGRKRYRRDLDKLMRSVLDSLTGIIWTDDEQVDSAHLDKCQGDTPGMEIVVERIGVMMRHAR